MAYADNDMQYIGLLTAIVKQARDDYIHAERLRIRYGTYNGQLKVAAVRRRSTAERMQRAYKTGLDAAQFLLSDWGELLTFGHGADMLEAFRLAAQEKEAAFAAQQHKKKHNKPHSVIVRK